MKSIVYLLTILFLSLLLACSEEPLTNVETETLTKKPIKDPPPDPTEPLDLLDADNQIVGISGYPTKGKIKVWTYEGGSYSETWLKEDDGLYEVSAIGDVDNDGSDELVAVYIYKTGKGRNKETHTVIHIFENGATEPSRTSDDLEGIGGHLYMRLGDANNNGHLEILISSLNGLLVYNDDGSEVTKLWQSENLSAVGPFSIDVGDPDSDGLNEIIYAELFGQRFGVYEHLGNNVW